MFKMLSAAHFEAVHVHAVVCLCADRRLVVASAEEEHRHTRLCTELRENGIQPAFVHTCLREHDNQSELWVLQLARNEGSVEVAAVVGDLDQFGKAVKIKYKGKNGYFSERT